MDPFDEASAAFLLWLKSSGAEISNKIELKDLRNIEAGRGVGKQYLLLVSQTLFTPESCLLLRLPARFQLYTKHD
jgi:SET domain-containing protein 6